MTSFVPRATSLLSGLNELVKQFAGQVRLALLIGKLISFCLIVSLAAFGAVTFLLAAPYTGAPLAILAVCLEMVAIATALHFGARWKR